MRLRGEVMQYNGGGDRVTGRHQVSPGMFSEEQVAIVMSLMCDEQC